MNRRLDKAFLSAEIADISQACRLGIRQAGQELQKRLQSAAPNKKSARLRTVANPRESPVAYVSLFGALLGEFSEGNASKGKAVILLPAGERLGFPRVSRAGEWAGLVRQHGDQLGRVEVQGGVVITYQAKRHQQPIAVYKIQSQPRSHSSQSALAIANQSADKIPVRIAQNLEVL